MSSKTTTGEVGRREEGVGNISPALVRERAAQLAVMDGRSEAEVREGDLDRAEAELRGDLDMGATVRGDMPNPEASLQPDEAVPSTGRQARPRGATDESTIAQQLVEEGVEQAVHDEMLESGKETLEEAEDERPGER